MGNCRCRSTALSSGRRGERILAVSVSQTRSGKTASASRSEGVHPPDAHAVRELMKNFMRSSGVESMMAPEM
jgi:hypothetical protein